MINLLKKELKLATSPMTYIFLVFAVMVLIPSYPILMSAFFICLGIFQSFHQARVTNDFLFTALLPIKKKDVVRSKYIMVCFFEMVGFLLIVILSILRMTVMKDEVVYRDNFMMNANLVFLGFCLLIFLMFNVIFVKLFFNTVYKINKPYILFLIVAVVLIGIGEMLHFFPALSFLNDNLGEATTVSAEASMLVQIIFFAVCAVLYICGTLLAVRSSQKKFAALDL